MYDVIGVSFKTIKSLFFLSPNNLNIKKSDIVVANTENGIQLGLVKTNIIKKNEKDINLPLNNIIRIATNDDLNKHKKNNDDSISALEEAKRISKNLKLNMKFIDAYYNFDRSQLFFSFVSDERIDFRELAKKLAQKYKTRIELRQIGVRDKSKKIGGLGPCGLLLCCNSFLNDFNSVSINMAKNQMLALNPSKINGVCGRLLCCLEYENDTYLNIKKELPKLGSFVNINGDVGKVISIDVLKKNVKIDFKEKGIVDIPNGDINGSN